VEHEPVLDDGQGKPEKVKKKEKKGAIIAVAALVVFIAIAIAVSLGNARMYYEAVKRWEREGVVTRYKYTIAQSWDSATKSED
jgi:hypothetical protein